MGGGLAAARVSWALMANAAAGGAGHRAHEAYLVCPRSALYNALPRRALPPSSRSGEFPDRPLADILSSSLRHYSAMPLGAGRPSGSAARLLERAKLQPLDGVRPICAVK